MFESIAKSWLTLQCQMIPSVVRAFVSLDRVEGDRLVATASWPEGKGTTNEMNAAGLQAVSQRSAVVLPKNADVPAIVACPMLSEDRVFGVVAIQLEQLDAQQHQAIVQLLNWGSALLEFMLRQGTGTAVAGRLAAVVETTVKSLEHAELAAAATTAVSHLAQELSCERVSLGLLKRGRIELCALSNSARPERRSELVNHLEAAMDEAVDEANTIAYPCPNKSSPPSASAHERLARSQNSVAVWTVLLHSRDTVIGTLTFERSAGEEFQPSIIELCESVAALLGPVIELKRLDDRALWAKVKDSSANACSRLVGPGHLRTKMAALVTAVALAFLCVASGEYRVAAGAALEGTIHRALVAPIDGYVLDAAMRSGSLVKKGQLLATLDDRDLKLQLARWQHERREYESQHRRAVATFDRAEAKVLRALVGKAAARAALIEEQLARTRIVAPFNGVIVSGDLSHSIGAPVERGQVLFEVAPLDAYRMALEVSENDIADVVPGQRGSLVLAALPAERFAFVIDNVVGMAESADGINKFRVEASLASDSPNLRPGMKGVAKIGIEQRKLAWIWSHNLLERVKLWLWAHLP